MDKKQLLLDGYVKILKGHFDSVRVFCTKHEDEGDVTFSFDSGRGNLQAQLGQIRAWLLEKDAIAKRDGWDHAYECRGSSEDRGNE